jgi:hypothetical protein
VKNEIRCAISRKKFEIYLRAWTVNLYNLEMTTRYDQLCIDFEKESCRLLTSEDEYNEMIKVMRIPKVHYIASCGHENRVHTNVFLGKRKTGIKCPACVSKEMGLKKVGRIESDGQSCNSCTEDKCVGYVMDIIKDTFECKKTNDGCLADLAIKPTENPNNEWMMIQFKTTEKPLNEYGFHLKKKLQYRDMAVLCVCWSDKRMWLFKGDTLDTTKISVGLKKSKYSGNEVKAENVLAKLRDLYIKLPLSALDDIQVPVSACQKLEHEYRLLRTSKVNCLDFVDSTKSNMVYDFIANGKRVQEKVCTRHRTKKSVIVGCHKNAGRINIDIGAKQKRQFMCYEENDNDIYWFHFPGKKYFYVLPEKELIESRNIKTSTSDGKKMIYISLDKDNKPKRKEWNGFLFEYDDVDEKRLLKLFN